MSNRAPLIAGLGMTELGRVYGRSAREFAVDAVRNAVTDSGLSMADVDGLLINSGISERIPLDIAKDLQLGDLRLLMEAHSYGATAGSMVMLAAMAVRDGLADTVACVFADAPLVEGVPTGASYSGRRTPSGLTGLVVAAGLKTTTSMYALAARRHMLRYGTTSEDFAAIAVAQRQWAAGNPLAQLRRPISVEDHQSSRWISDPLRLLDCCLVSNGGIAVLVTSQERLADLAQPPVYVHGYAQSHPRYSGYGDDNFGLESGAARSGPAALRMAGLRPADVDIAELYDCYTFTALLTMEDYGFCEKGECGDFVRSGATAPGGSLAVNTGGGQLSSYYMWGMTPLSEAVIQGRGQGGMRQAPENDLILVSGNGGIFDFHGTL
ncbi:MAG TPA: thiolase family protein, partial [Jatrophihabitantaceae bacterium]|nr:thiolase family protein [Jatrophihabitantaceae bacterium]